MPSFTFTSEDLEKVNENKKTNDKIFPQLENIRTTPSSPSLMDRDGNLNMEQVNNLFRRDASRGTPTVLKQADNLTVIFDDKTRREDLAANPIDSSLGLLKQSGLSQRQIDDFKIMTNQSNIGAIAGHIQEYVMTKQPAFIENIQYDSGILAHLEVVKAQPPAQAQLIYSTTTKVTFDKSPTECTYKNYGVGSSNNISTKDSLSVIIKVNLGTIGSDDYKPKLTCSIYAEGEISKTVLKNMQSDIPIASDTLNKSPQQFQTEYQNISVKTLEATGYHQAFEQQLKDDIQVLLGDPNSRQIYDHNIAALRNFNSTPKLFAEVLVDKIDEAIKKDTPEARKQAIQDLSQNASSLIDQPRGYMNILIKNIAQDRATKAGQALPKEKFIQRCKDKINLMFAKWQSKSASQNIKIIREINKAKSIGLSR